MIWRTYARIIIIIYAVFLCNITISANTGLGSIKGVLTDSVSGEPIANVEVQKGENVVAGSPTDFDGSYIIDSVPIGIYNIQVKYIGYPTFKRTELNVMEGIYTYDLSLPPGRSIKGCRIVKFKIPLLDNSTDSLSNTAE